VAGRVLVVEDHPTMRDAVRAILSSDGYEVDTVADGAEALERIRRTPPDLVLIDLNLPGLPGAHLLRAIKADPTTAHIPAIVVTAAGEHERDRALELGAADYFSKPFSPAALLRGVEQALRADGLPATSP